MQESPQFRLDFGMLAFLTNAGRINTTMACQSLYNTLRNLLIDRRIVFPEMRTALRTYHAIPSLQKTDGNLQDAPRIKNALKAAVTDAESVSTPHDVVSRQVRLFVVV
jgi:Ino eighty subunit 1